MNRISSNSAFYLFHYDKISVVVVLVFVTLCAGCTQLTDFDRDKIKRNGDTNSITTEGGLEEPIQLPEGGLSDASTSVSKRDSGGRETSIPIRDARIGDAPVGDASNTNCIPRFTECDAECGIISDGCGNNIECGSCDAGFMCREHECVSECDGCYIDEVCYRTGAVSHANQCEVCSPAISQTSWSPNTGALCNDGKFCTVSDVCEGTVCTGTSRNCDDGIGCNGQETCSESDGSCVVGTPTCDVGEYCDAVSDSCVSICGPTDCIINRTCYQNSAQNAANICLVCNSAANKNDWSVAVGQACGDAAAECSGQDTCDASGDCVQNNAPRGTNCGAAETECSGQDTCDGNGNCLPNHFGLLTPCGTPVECENQDYCDGNGNCVDALFMWPGSICGDGPTDCSGQDTCDWSGRCLPNNYQDGIHCGPNASACSWRICERGVCGTQVFYQTCNDSIACTSDSCNPSTGCQYTPNDNACDDDIDCTSDSCDRRTGCVFQPNDSACNDHIDCTSDSCDQTNGCVFQPNDSACNDNIDCTSDSCDQTNGCVFQPNNSFCEANVANIECVTSAACNPTGCDSCNASTNCSCVGTIGCTYQLDHTECNDSFDCTTDSCNPNAGGCQHTPNQSACNDQIPCTSNSCNTSAGCVYTPDNNACPDDSNPCTNNICAPDDDESDENGCIYPDAGTCGTSGTSGTGGTDNRSRPSR